MSVRLASSDNALNSFVAVLFFFMYAHFSFHSSSQRKLYQQNVILSIVQIVCKSFSRLGLYSSLSSTLILRTFGSTKKYRCEFFHFTNAYLSPHRSMWAWTGKYIGYILSPDWIIVLWLRIRKGCSQSVRWTGFGVRSTQKRILIYEKDARHSEVRIAKRAATKVKK